MKKALCLLMLIVIALVCLTGCEKVSEKGEYMSSDQSYVIKLSNGVASVMENGYYQKLGTYTYSDGELEISAPSGLVTGSISSNGEYLTITFPDGTIDRCKKLSTPTGK